MLAVGFGRTASTFSQLWAMRNVFPLGTTDTDNIGDLTSIGIEFLCHRGAVVKFSLSDREVTVSNPTCRGVRHKCRCPIAIKAPGNIMLIFEKFSICLHYRVLNGLTVGME